MRLRFTEALGAVIVLAVTIAACTIALASLCGCAAVESGSTWPESDEFAHIETGAELYPFADALEDAYTALLMASPAVTPGAGLDGPAAAGLAPGWYQRRTAPRPWK